MIKILSIGNSFSQDATALLQLLTNDIKVRNMDIGGCSLARHHANINGNIADYCFEENGDALKRERITLLEGLTGDDYDYITLQQYSGESGVLESYYPHLPEIISYIRAHSKAKIVFFQTWAYERSVNWDNFAPHYASQAEMWQKIKRTSETVAKNEGLPLIRGGEAIQALREKSCFDYNKGGLSLNRDGVHLTLNYGRLLMASLWHKFFLHSLPEFFNRDELSEPIKQIKEVLEQI